MKTAFFSRLKCLRVQKCWKFKHQLLPHTTSFQPPLAQNIGCPGSFPFSIVSLYVTSNHTQTGRRNTKREREKLRPKYNVESLYVSIWRVVFYEFLYFLHMRVDLNISPETKHQNNNFIYLNGVLFYLYKCVCDLERIF